MKKLLALLLALGWAPPVIAASPGLAPAGMVYTGPASGSASVPAFRALTDVYSAAMGSAAGRGVAVRVQSEVELEALSVATTPVVLRYDFFPGLGAAPVLYVGQAGACSQADKGAQVSSADGGCYIAHFTNGVGGPKEWGASGSADTAACSTASSTTVTCSGGAADFKVGESVAIYGAGPSSSASAPTLGVTPLNGSGTTMWYVAVPIDTSMGPGPASTAASVSGGGAAGVLGTPLDFDYTMTGNTHGSTTLDSLKIGGVACTSTTCPLAVGDIVQNDAQFAIPTTIASITSPTSVVLSASALTTTVGVSVGLRSTQQGVFNQLATSGSASSYALYEGSSATLSSMVCIGILDGSPTLNNSLFDDYGPSHYTPCPAWLPATPTASALGETLRTTITAISGNTVTLASPASKTVASTTMLHDDTGALSAAMAWGGPLKFPCGVYNIFAGLTLPAAKVDGEQCATIAGYGTGFDDLTMASNGQLVNMHGDDTAKSSGFGLTVNGASIRVSVDNYNLTNRVNGIQAERASAPIFTNVNLIGKGRGDQSIYLWSPAGTAMVAPYFGNVVVSQSATSAGLLVDSDVDSLLTDNLDIQQAPREVVYQNTIAGGAPPFAARFRNFACNFGWGGPCVDFEAANAQLTISRAFLQGVGGGNGVAGSAGAPCVKSAAGVAPLTIDSNSEIFACDQAGVDNFGQYLHMADGSDELYANSYTQHGAFSKVIAESGSGPGTIKLAAGDNFSGGNSTSTTEKCGISIMSGAGTTNGPIGSPAFDVTDAGPGIVAPVCDNTATYGTVRVNGQLNSPGFVANSAGGTLTVGQMLGNQNGTTPSLYISGNVLGTPVTWTTPTAVLLLAGVQNANTNQKFPLNLYNQGSSIVTLAGGTGVTITGTATTNQFVGPHLIICWFTNTGTPAMTCHG